MVITEAVIRAEQGQQPHVTARLKELFSQLFGIELHEIDGHTSFLEMGADSLSLLRVSQILQDKFNVKIPFRLLLEELSTIDELAAHIARENPIETQPQEQPAPGPVELPTPLAEVTVKLVPAEGLTDPQEAQATADFSTPVPRVEILLPIPTADDSTAEGSPLERILSLQMRLLSDQLKQQTGIMSLQLELLQAPRASSEKVISPGKIVGPKPVLQKAVLPIEILLPTPSISSNGGASRKLEPDKPGKSDYFETETFVAYHPVKKDKQRGLTQRQQEHLDALIERVTARTKESKRLTQAYRPFLADGRTSAGFRQTWKEMCYPLVIERGLGSRVYDVDHNEYVDLTMGFGALLFGHSPPFLVDALQEAVTQGVRLGGQSHIVGQAAQLICELTGVERVAFYNSGTEAVMSALRLARTVTGRTKIALFEGSYHGTFDGVMVKPGDSEANGTFKAMPLAPGVPLHMIENVLLLGYDDAASLEVIRAHAHELAAVLIEPPRSRHPDVQPRAFLHELRKITEEAGAALIFDEVVTGFRFHPGGVQALFGVQADLVAYGKALGGGVPVAAVGGKARFMDATDGGIWSYGDASYPRAETTFFAGTYFKNPLVVAAVWACLNHIKNSGPKLYEELNNRTSRLVRTLNDYFVQEQVPMRTTHLGSLMRFLYPREFKLMDLFFYHLLAKGIYICETRNCFLSTAHTDEDVEKIVQAVKETIVEMRDGGIIPPRSPDASNGDGASNYEIKDPFGGLADSFSRATAEQSPAPSRQAIEREKATEAVILPLTEAQKQLWFLAQIDEQASVAYHISISLEMRGALNLAVMRKAVQSVVNDHEALRITFSADGEYQQIAPSLAVKLPLVDFTHHLGRDRELEVARWIDEEVRKPFDLVRGPLLRPHILKLEEDVHVFLLTIHHIITDGWSLGILLKELSARYSAACTGEVCELSRSMQFSEYVGWEADQRAGSGLEMAEAYWMKQFVGEIPTPDLPSDYPRPPIQTYAGARVQTKIDGAMKGKLESFSTRQGTTLLMTLLAGFNLLLHRLSGQEGLVVGIPSAGQMAAGGSLMGYCINVLPLYSRIAGDPTFTDYLSFVKKLLLDASEHQIYPLRSIINKLNLPRDPSRAPLVTVMFNVDRAGSKPHLAGLETTLVQNTTGSAQFDLSLNVTVDSGELQLDCDFNTSLFSELTIRRWLGNFRSLLEAAISNPQTPVSALPLLTVEERQQVLYGWNETKRDFGVERCLHEEFERQVDERAEAIAVVYGEESLSYGELNLRANQVAHRLRAEGVGPEVLVGIMMERSLEMVTGLLGILKAGGAYVPLDPGDPRERMSFMLADAQVPVLLTQRRLLGQLPDYAGRVICLDDGDERLAAEETSNPVSGVFAESPAYMIYTSGSTGRPKGALNTHRAIVNRLRWMQEAYKLSAADRVLQKTPFSFDVSVWEFFWPLLTGARLVMARPGGHRDSLYLSRLIVEQQITTVHFVPSMLQVFLEEPELADMDCLRRVICSGEALSYELQERFFARLGTELHNLYGPTEAAVDVTYWACERGGERRSVPIGRPIANTQIFILDGRTQPVPVGVAGELYIGGVALARGYLNRPDLTAEKFVPDPFSEKAGGRLYRTGDLARHGAGGEIEYLGRLDHQVKIRGFRIELGEIETVLAEHPAILKAVVVARTDIAGDTRLVAYLVPIRQDGPTVSELRLFLLDKLPDYMVPATFAMLDSLPLMPNGKVDRAALPVPDQSRPALEKGYVAASTPAEQLLAKVWGEVLRLERVGVDDNFFELGGDSILVIQAIIKSNRSGVRLTAAQYFQHQTIAGLAGVAGISDDLRVNDGPEAATTKPPLVELAQETLDSLAERYGRLQDIYPLTPTQQGMLFQRLYAPESKAYLQQLSCDLDGELDSRAFKFAWQQVFARHPVLRSAFIWEALKEPLQVVSQEVELPFAEEDWRDLEVGKQQAKLNTLLANEGDQNFDLTQSPVSRLTLIRLADDEYKFIWSYHHILMDGWSLNVLLEEAFALYESLRNGRALELEARAPYRNYIAWLQQQDMVAAEEYWRKSLKGFTAPTPLGVDKALADSPEVEEFGEVSLRLSATATSMLQSLTRVHKLTMSTVVQGVWGLLLSHYSGQPDVVFGTVVSGRPPELAGVETMVGLFINTLPVRVEVKSESTMVDWLRELQERQAEARRYEYSPLVQVQGWSEVPRGVPLFESLLAFQNYPLDISLEKHKVSITSRNVSSRERVNYALFVMAAPGPELALTIYYDGRRFERATVERMLGHLLTLLEETAANPSRQLSNMTLLTPAERRRLLTEWNDTREDYPQDVCLHQLFEAQVARTPDRIAVVSEDEHVTYAELDRRANQLANYLRLEGVRKELLVGICLERTVEMVVGLLAILKAGGAYVPLDPTYPKERLSFIMKDAQMRVLLTQQHLLTDLPATENAHVISVDSCTKRIRTESESQPESGVCANNLAYVIYTSGSTGTPKGVEITHRAVVNFLHSMRNQPGLTDSDVLLAVTSLSFDIAGLELFLPLMVGARLELASRQEAGDGLKLMARLRESEATVMQATPTGWELLLNAGWHNDDRPLKILCGGEAFPRGLANRLLEEHAPVWNLYGPTETTIWSTMCQVGPASGSVPIGRPIANTQVYITDADLRPAAIGVAGELYIGGDSLSRGYLRRPGLTAEKFVPDPFSGVAGARLYRTGDMARYLPDGEIEFLGRSDQQVKIRGYRIELGEIETALNSYQGVRQAVVSAREDLPGEKRLVAYLVWDVGDSAEFTPPHASALRTHLKHSLPDYMLPAVFVTLEQLPLTPNGKIDRRALPAPDRTRPDLDKAYVEARTAEEALLVEIWKDVLGVERVGVYDNFLELGGDSILSLQVIIRATQVGMRLTPAQLFQRQTVAELASVVALSLPENIFDELSGEVPLTPIQHWFFEQDLPDPHHVSQSVLLEIPAHLEASLIEKAVEDLFIRHDALRLRFTNVEGRWQQKVNVWAGETPFSVHTFSSLPASEHPAAIESVAGKIQGALNLSEGPLAGIALITFGEQKRRLLMVIHHLAVDITSWRILLEDFQTICERLSRHAEIEPPARTTSFASWSHELSRFAQSAELSVEADYWRHAVSHATACLPLDFEGENTEDSSDAVLSTFSREETWSLLHDTPKAFRTLPSEVLLTALAQAFAEWSDEKVLLIELEGHGRESISDAMDLSRTVAWFTSLYPVRLDIAEAEDPVAALKLIKEQVRNVPRGGIGFGALKYLRRESEISKLLWAACRPEVSFNYIGAQKVAARDENGIRLAAEKYGTVKGERGMRPYLLMVTAQITKERLTVQWTYSKNVHREATIRGLVESFEGAFRLLIGHCQTADANTPSDFPNANLSQSALDEFIATIGSVR